ncbi:DUF2177 family protein [Pseudorhodobacter sp.]|uniref:DUF2177 family protein n=1 Tax=Pseudorhodobacter sp. TaxID=1934400 RepID=UPI002646FC34|nr:DUF2177 family protein [Pseudorhodobacter sp.]MDN5787013.1 DUF2177 family protein [Pseudorhodobacter sp.]
MSVIAFLIFFAATSIIFLGADALMLGFVIGPMFRAALQDSLLQGLRPAAAIGFYLLYMAGITYFAGLPALRAGSANIALLNGLILGLVAYGTYELTSWSVMRDWHVGMVATDMLWGAALTGVAAYCGARISLAFAV